MKKIGFILFVIFIFGASFLAEAEPGAKLAPHKNQPHKNQAVKRGIFVSVIQNPPTLESREDMTRLIAFARKAGVQTLFVQIYRGNKAWFQSKVGDSTPYHQAFEKAGEDPFAFLIRSAHAAKIEVHAWLNLMSLSDNENAPLLKKYGTKILTRDTKPKKMLSDYKIDNQYWLEPSDRRVRKAMAKMVEEVLRAYPDLDGVQFDYIRYPDTRPFYGYSKANMKRFKKATGLKKIDENNPLWKNWKRDQVTGLLETLIQKAQEIHPGIQISTTGCMSYVRAYHEAFQDWALWLKSGLVEFVTMMSYPPDVTTFEKNIAEAKSRVENFAKVNVGLGAYKLRQTPEVFAKQWEICEKAGGRSCVVFHYGDLLEEPVLAQPLLEAKTPSTEQA